MPYTGRSLIYMFEQREPLSEPSHAGAPTDVQFEFAENAVQGQTTAPASASEPLPVGRGEAGGFQPQRQWPSWRQRLCWTAWLTSAVLLSYGGITYRIQADDRLFLSLERAADGGRLVMISAWLLSAHGSTWQFGTAFRLGTPLR